MFGLRELDDEAQTSSEVNGLKNVVVLSDELLVAGVSAAFVAVDWTTGDISTTDVVPTDDAAGVKKCWLTGCGSDAGSVNDVMSRCDAMVFVCVTGVGWRSLV